MFPFIIPVIREVVRYFQADQNGCGGRGPVNTGQGENSPTPTSPQQDNTPTTPAGQNSFLERAVNFLRRLSPDIRRHVGPLRSPAAERMIREHVIPMVQEGSMFLPEHMPNLVGLTPADMAIELGLSVALWPLGPVSGMPARYLLRRGIQNYREGTHELTWNPNSNRPGNNAGVAAAASRQYTTFHRVPGVYQDPVSLMCR